MSTTLFQVDPKLPFAAFVNPIIASAQRLGLAEQYNGLLSGFGGDELVGQLTPGTTIPWNQTTELQGLIVEYYETQGDKEPTANPGLPADLEAILKANVGPVASWNWSYEQAGLIPGMPAAFNTLDTVEVRTGRAVTVILL